MTAIIRSRNVAVIGALAVLLLGGICVAVSPKAVTLVPPMDPGTKKYDEGPSFFNFKNGKLKKDSRTSEVYDWDLAYGSFSINNEDWFTLRNFHGSRSVVKDLGELKWSDHFAIPRLEPRPVVPEGKATITVDASADTHKAWAAAATTFSKVVPGHMYLMHIKEKKADFYVLFRVEKLEQQKLCEFSWRRTSRAGHTNQ